MLPDRMGSIPRKKTPSEGLCWPEREALRLSIGSWATSWLRPRLAAERGFFQTVAAGFVALELWSSRKRKSAILRPELGREVVCFLGCAETNIDRTDEDSPISDLIHWPSAVRAGCGELHRVNLDVPRPCSVPLSVGSGRIGPENELQGWLSARTWSRRRCIMSGVMPSRRKINTKPGRLAARERVRELVSEHDDRVVLLIWGGRVLGWSLRRIAAALEGSIAPPGRRAGYTAGR